MTLKDKLEIVVITYNRCLLLKDTLNSLLGSCFAQCRITILDNKSTDNTIEIAGEFLPLFSDLQIITNKLNIGADANILRAIEISSAEYLWVLCDDDFYDFSNTQDVEQRIVEGEVELIHMGAHEEDSWDFGGRIDTPKNLMFEGYPYFKASSFVPNNLFKRSLFPNFMIDGYRNVINMYPHMPFLFSFFTNNSQIYIANNRIVRAGIGQQGYGLMNWMEGWINTSLLLSPTENARACFFDQFPRKGKLNRIRVAYQVFFGVIKKRYYYRTFRKLWNLLCFSDKVLFVVGFLGYILFKCLFPRSEVKIENAK